MAGDFLRRQLKLTEDYCERKGLILDDSLNLRDLGVSGCHGKNADAGALARFLEAIKLKRVPVGPTLIVENLDRVSHNDIDEALPLLMGILKAGRPGFTSARQPRRAGPHGPARRPRT